MSPSAYPECLEQGWGKWDYDRIVHGVGLRQAGAREPKVSASEARF